MPTNLRFLTVALLLGASTPGQDGRALFLAHCATCHGHAGRGDGPTQLRPRPRDLTSAQLSSGTTTEAIGRTIRVGVAPAMPAFEGTFEAPELAALVGYVRALIPATLEAPPAQSQVLIGSEARVVRGSLPATATRATSLRGLVIGLTNGWSVEYRTDDLRRLGLRRPGAAAAFVDRTDWRGRGGSPLALLGAPVASTATDPDPTVSDAPGTTPLRIAFDGHRVSGPRVRLDGRLIDRHAELGRWREIVRGVDTGLGQGIHRRVEIRSDGLPVDVRLRVGALLGSTNVNRKQETVLRGEQAFYWSATRRDGTFAVIGVRVPRGSYLTIPEGHLEIIIPLGDRPLTRLEILRMELPNMTHSMIAELSEEFDR